MTLILHRNAPSAYLHPDPVAAPCWHSLNLYVYVSVCVVVVEKNSCSRYVIVNVILTLNL